MLMMCFRQYGWRRQRWRWGRRSGVSAGRAAGRLRTESITQSTVSHPSSTARHRLRRHRRAAQASSRYTPAAFLADRT